MECGLFNNLYLDIFLQLRTEEKPFFFSLQISFVKCNMYNCTKLLATRKRWIYSNLIWMNSLKAKVCFSYYLLFYLSIWREISVKYFESELVNSWHKIGLVCSICPWKLWLQNKSWKKRRLIFSWRLHLLLLLKFSFHAPTIILFTILQVSFFHNYHHLIQCNYHPPLPLPHNDH